MIELYLYINYQTNLIWKRSVLVHDKLSLIEVVVVSMRNEIKIGYIIVEKNYETTFETSIYLKIISMFVLGGAYLPSKVVTWGPFTDLHRAGLSISSTVTYKDWKTKC